MRLSSSSFKLIILSSFCCSCLFAFIQIFCFSKQSIFERKCSSHEREHSHQDKSVLPHPSLVHNSTINLPTIFLITPTYFRYTQKADLTRLSYALLHVQNIHWILVEDSDNKTELVTNFIARLRQLIQDANGFQVTHLNAATPPEYKRKSSDPVWLKPRGVLQRNEALQWLRRNRKKLDNRGVIYFADDDNTYDLRLFDEMRYTQRVSVWPVGIVGGLLVERPLVRKGKVYGWNTAWRPERPFPIDMAGFALSFQLILKHPKAIFLLTVPRGFQESFFLKKIVRGLHELEPKADNCTKVYVWHTRTETPKLRHEFALRDTPSNLGIEI